MVESDTVAPDCDDDLSEDGHHDLVGQPHPDASGPVAEAELIAAEISTDEEPLGSPGRRFDRRSPFFIGVTASAGVAVTYGAVQILSSLSSVLILIGVAFFLALGLSRRRPGSSTAGCPAGRRRRWCSPFSSCWSVVSWRPRFRRWRIRRVS